MTVSNLLSANPEQSQPYQTSVRGSNVRLAPENLVPVTRGNSRHQDMVLMNTVKHLKN